MTGRFTAWVRRQPVGALYALAFLFTWLGWLPQAAYSRGWFPFDSPLFYVLGGVGPLLAAFVVQSALRGSSAIGELFLPLGRWKVGWPWYAAALLLYPAAWLAALLWRGDLAEQAAQLGPLASVLMAFAVAFAAAIPEEIAWRGMVLPRLQARYSALVSSGIIGALALVWHLPLLWNRGNVMSTYGLLPFAVEVLALTVLYTWIFNNTRGSLLLVTLFHAATNAAGAFLGWQQGVVLLVIAAAVVAVFGPAHLTRQGGRVEEQPGAESMPGRAAAKPL